MVGGQQCHRAPPSAFLSLGDPLSPRVRCSHRIGGLLLLRRESGSSSILTWR